MKVTITGLLRPADGAVASSISGAVAYNHSLTEYIMDLANQSEIVKTQRSLPGYDLLTGLEFDKGQYRNLSDQKKAELLDSYLSGNRTFTGAAPVDETKIEIILALMSTLTEEEEKDLVSKKVDAMSTEDRAMYLFTRFDGLYSSNPALYKSIMLDLMRVYLGPQYDSMASRFEGMTAEQLQQMMSQMGGGSDGPQMTPEQQMEAMLPVFSMIDADVLHAYVSEIYLSEVTGNLADELRETYTDEELVALFDERYNGMTESERAALYDRYMPEMLSENTYDDVMFDIGGALRSVPKTINLYAKDFASKDALTDLIKRYNDQAEKSDEITYTDYVGLMMSSITTIIDVISYVLIAFVSISLVVSSIMIGIITYISVLERTKEIGILRAIGASKRNVSSVFNAETLIVGFASGAIGIIVTVLLCFPINWIIRSVSGIASIGAELPVIGAVVLILISMGLTAIAGLIPSRLAAKKDPVVALRSE